MFFTSIKNFFKSEKGLFLLVLGAELLQILYFIFDQRLISHDTLQRFIIQYYFLNNAVMTGEVPQWIPHLTHGTTAYWWHGIQGSNGLLLYPLFLIAPLLKGLNFFPIYYLCVLFDKLILLSGVWFLGRRYFNSKYTIFIVSVAAVGSSIWMSQAYFNFYFYYCVPWILFFVHRFIDTQKWRYGFLAFNIFVLQIVGNSAYFIPILTFIIFTYFFFYLLLNAKKIPGFIRKFSINRELWFSLLGVALSGILVYLLLSAGMDDQIAYQHQDRHFSGRGTATPMVALKPSVLLNRWVELFLGFSRGTDFTFYIGVLGLPFIVLGLWGRKDVKKWVLLSLITVLSFFMLGSFLTILAYEYWPLMSYYRHISYLLPFIRLFFCFLMGYGFEVIFLNSKQSYSKVYKILIGLMMAFLLCLAGQFVFAANNIEMLLKFQEKVGFAMPIEVSQGLRMYGPLFLYSAVKIFIVAILLISLLICQGKKRGYIKGILAAALVFHFIDVYGYALHEARKRTVPINKDYYHVTNFQDMPYQHQRRRSLLQNNRRDFFDIKSLQKGENYWIMNSFLFHDQLGTSFRTDLWQKPLDQLLQSFREEDLGLLEKDRKLKFPENHPAILRITGVKNDKIQFFSRFYSLPGSKALSKKLVHSANLGNVLLLTPDTDVLTLRFKAPIWHGDHVLSEDHRLEIPYTVTEFSANRLKLSVEVPEKEIFLYYADVWHPDWKVNVNGKKAGMHRANMAYKAVRLQKGFNEVHFYFYSDFMAWIVRIIGLNVLFWLAVMLLYVMRILHLKKNSIEHHEILT